MTAARVLVVGGDPLARAGVTALLLGAPEVAVAGAGATDEAPALLLALAPGVVCWDAGGEAGSAPGLVSAAGDVPVLALLGEALEAGEAGELWRAGVRSILPRRVGGRALAIGLLAASRGLAVLEPGPAAAWLRPTAPPDGDDGPDPLTPREREVLSLLAEGLGNKAIAVRLDVSEHTAKFHVNAILGKLGATTRTEAVVLAARRGLVAL
jgi:two-component system, NarL family, nitrate/nitrite response regulator NarL